MTSSQIHFLTDMWFGAVLQDALAASLGTLQELRGVDCDQPLRGLSSTADGPWSCPTLERFGELRVVLLSGVYDTMHPWARPRLPVNLRKLTLCSGPHKSAPSRLRLAHLTRLEELVLDGYESFHPLFKSWDAGKEGPPLPASLTALCLESAHPIDIGELAGGMTMPAAGCGPTLSTRSALVRCSPQRLPRQPRNRLPGNIAVAGHAAPMAGRPTDGLVGKLPAGFGALELHTQCVTINCSAVLPETDPEDAVRELCLFFSRAPASYRRFSVFWSTDSSPLEVRLSSLLEVAHPGAAALMRQVQVTLASVEALAESMQSYAADNCMSVAVRAEPLRHLAVIRL